MKRRVLELACGLALLVAGGALLVHRAEHPPAAPVAVIPAEGLPSPRPRTPVAPVAPAAAAPAAGEAGDAAARASWSRRLSREDDFLVEQAVQAGCDNERAAKLRDLLASKRASRERTIADFEAGKITEAEMHRSARAAKKDFDDAAKTLLRAEELEALDPTGARTKVLLEEKQQPR